MKLELDAVKRSYKNRTVLDIKSLQLDSGKIYAVIGPNGAGKTTLLRLISGVDKADAGNILYDSKREFPEGEISYMPQKAYIFDFSVLDNVMLALKKSSEMKERAISALECLNMGAFINEAAIRLSGGEAQKVAVARNLIQEKKLILLDEPTSCIDIASTGLVEAFIKKVNISSGATVILTTHNPSQAYRLADEVIMLCQGNVVEKGKPEQVFASPLSSLTRDFIQNWRI